MIDLPPQGPQFLEKSMDTVYENNMSPVFEGTPDEVEDWLRENTTKYNDRLLVHIGSNKRLITALEYLDA